MIARLFEWIRFCIADTAARVALLASLSLGLAGCYDQTVRVSFSPNGQADLRLDIDFSRDAKDVIAFTDALIQLTPEGAALFDGGMCKSLATLASMSPEAGLALKSEQVDGADKVSCRVSATLGDSQQAADKLALLFGLATDPTKNKVLTITNAGERRLRIEIDFSKGGDPDQILRTAMVEGFAAFGRPANNAAISRAIDAYVPAMVSMGRMMGRDRGVTFAIDALRVIETNGEQRGNSAVFRWSWEEIISRQFKVKGIESKAYYAIIQY